VPDSGEARGTALLKLIVHPLSISSSTHDQWTPELAVQLAGLACRTTGLSHSGLKLVRFGTNAVFEVCGAHVALRLRRPGTAPSEIEQQVAFAKWLAENDFPVNRPVEGLTVLHEGLDGAVASFWEWIDDDRGGRIDTRELGALIRRFHDLTDECPMAAAFPQWDAIAEIEQRIWALEQEAGRWLPRTQLDLIRQWLRENESELNGVDWRLPTGLIHGDAHTGNVLAIRSGGGLLIDLDAVTRGHREWDLVPTAVSRLRFRDDMDSISEFATAYGFDLLNWSGWPAMRRLRELYMTSWLMTVASSRERQDEVNHRMNCLRAHDEESRWHAV
jgi:Ser/Thr protein kinase RdoA (MazF antagonist)